MKHYFKDDEDPEDLGISYFEFDGEYNTRKVVIKDDIWTYASEDYRPEILADQPLGICDPEIWQHEISSDDFYAIWDKAVLMHNHKA